MKKLALGLALFFLAISLLTYFNKYHKFREYKLSELPATLPPYKINLNLANEHEFDNLPGIGPALAQDIIEYRSSHGRFNSVEEINNVPGIGDKKMAQIREYLTLEVY